MQDTLLDIRGLKTWFKTEDGMVRAVDGVDLRIDRGETVGVVGESGCGKSTTGRCILRLIEPSSGEVWFQGKDVTKMDHGALQSLRRDMQIIFQDPFASLNPRMTVGQIIGEALVIHKLAKDGREHDAKDYLDIAAHWALFPGAAIFLTVLAINFIGDGLRDAVDPRRVL